MKEFEVSMIFECTTITVTAKDETEAKKKAYAKIKEKGPKILKKWTSVAEKPQNGYF